MKLSIKKYIDGTINKEAEIGYDKETRSWYGILNHTVGDIYSQRSSKSAVRKEMAEVLEEFIALYLKEEGKKVSRVDEIKTSKVQGVYR